MKILIIKSRLPITPEEPGAPRSFCLARELSKRGHQIHLLVFSQEEISPEAVNSLSSRNVFTSIEIKDIPKDLPKNSSIWIHRILNLTYSDLRIKQPEYLKKAKEISEEFFIANNCDIILGFGIASSQFINPKLPSVLDLCDSLSLLFLRKMERLIKTKESWLIFRDALSYRSFEKRVAKHFKSILFVSPIDRDWFVKFTYHNNTKVVPLGIDTEYFSPSKSLGENENICFTGVLDYEPNCDAIEYALDEIFPIIKAEYPRSKFLIAGKHTNRALPNNINQEGVELHTNVPDIRPFLNNSKVYLCPLRIGAGIKNKLLSAMACKVAIVTTSISIQGMGLIHNEHCLVGENADELAEYTVKLLKDKTLRDRLTTNAFKLVQKSSWEHSANILEQILESEIINQTRQSDPKSTS